MTSDSAAGENTAAVGQGEAGEGTEELVVVPEARTSAADQFKDVFSQAGRSELVRAAWFLTGDVHRAEDLVQHALVKTYLAWPRARAGDPMAYARRVLVNARIDTWRRTRREVLMPPDKFPDATLGDPTSAVDERDGLVVALQALGVRQRRVVVLRYVVGLSEREVADDLRITVGTVKSQASRALGRLRDLLAEPGTDGGPR